MLRIEGKRQRLVLRNEVNQIHSHDALQDGVKIRIKIAGQAFSENSVLTQYSIVIHRSLHEVRAIQRTLFYTTTWVNRYLLHSHYTLTAL